MTAPLMAVALLAVLSIIDWSEVTGGRMSNFSLIEDLLDVDEVANELHTTAEILDPALDAALSEVTSEAELPVQELSVDELPTGVEMSPTGNQSAGDVVSSVRPSPMERIDGVWPIEDYSPDGDGLRHLRNALSKRDSRRVRIAFIGDSYIEGDILTQDIRRLLQDEFGGHGVGYMSMHSEFPGFRRSVHQADQGWEARDMRNRSKDRIRPLSGEYCVGSSGAVLTLKGSKVDNADRWSSTKLLFLSDSDGEISIKTDAADSIFDVKASDKIQMIELQDETTKMTLTSRIQGVRVLGAWIEDNSGVGVDCMSLRGNSGVSHCDLSVEIAAEMNELLPYDLIVIEYGLNALSAGQTDYSYYGRLMTKVVERIRQCYPECDILMLGVGDRGRKSGATVRSMSTTGAMVSAQRKCARECGVMFWDMREAMGGEDAVVSWREKGLVNADYIHLNHKGGGELAKEFVNSLKMKLNESH